MAKLEFLVGNTPLADLDKLGKPFPHVRLLAKLEGNNPAGSVKDRAALSMFQGAIRRGELTPGTRIIEATSGNTGIALAMIAARLGYPMTLIMPESMTIERRASMSAYGAEIVLTPEGQSMEGSIDLCRQMVAEGRGINFDQFSNPDNWRAHFHGTGPEIWRDTEGEVTHFVSAMGTTGTIMGTSRALKAFNPKIRVVGVHPEEGAKIAGIRRWPEAYLPKIYEREWVDEILSVGDAEANEVTRRLAKEEGVFCGQSAGGAVAAALKLAATIPADQQATIVVILPDRGDRYLSTDLFR
ncbi:cysteine synthase CysM [Magnetofaba australis]|nr:cysteine synthase CysM [Magnetofaba australis]